MQKMFDMDALTDVLDADGCARGHAALTGILCAGAETGRAAQYAMQFTPGVKPLLLERWGEAIRAQLESSDLDFRLYLPDDNMPLDVRMNALSAWAREFLSALGEAGARLGRLGEDGRDTLRELEIIGQGARLGGDSPEAEEEIVVHLAEHLRLSVLLLHRLLNSPPSPVAQ